MRVAVYQGFPDIHFEMLGCAIEYCRTRGLEYDVFAYDDNAHAASWKAWYDTLFGHHAWRHPLDFGQLGGYDVVLLMTDDDISFEQTGYPSALRSKTVCIDHAYTRRIPACAVHINTRPHNDDRTWLLPVYNIPRRPKFDDGKIHVAIIGCHHVPKSADFFSKVFENPQSVTFHLFNRYIHAASLQSCRQDVQTYPNADTTTMVTTLAACHYCFCWDADYHMDNHLLSAAIPLAVSAGTQLIMSSRWNASGYKLDGVMMYNRENLPIHLTLDGLHITDLDSLVVTRDKRLDHALHVIHES